MIATESYTTHNTLVLFAILAAAIVVFTIGYLTGCWRESLRWREEFSWAEPTKQCKECGGIGWYWTEWSGKADADPYWSSMVIERPDPPDGTVCITCHVCGGSGRLPDSIDSPKQSA